MKTYIHRQNGFWTVENLPKSYKVGTTIDDYTKGAYVALSSEQAAFYIAHPNASQLECWNMQLLPVPVRTIEQAVQEKLMLIDMYDRSDAVNGFIVNGVSAWLTPDVRANYRNSIEAAELLRETTITFIIAGIAATSALQDARVMLAKIQRYADNCTIITETHKATIRTLLMIEAIDAYDYTVGYPDKEQFTLAPLSL